MAYGQLEGVRHRLPNEGSESVRALEPPRDVPPDASSLPLRFIVAALFLFPVAASNEGACRVSVVIASVFPSGQLAHVLVRTAL